MVTPKNERTDTTGIAKDPETKPPVFIIISDETGQKNRYEIQILDINNSGVSITSKTILTIGQAIHFSEDQKGWDLPESGVVMWTYNDNDEFKAGIKFN